MKLVVSVAPRACIKSGPGFKLMVYKIIRNSEIMIHCDSVHKSVLSTTTVF